MCKQIKKGEKCACESCGFRLVIRADDTFTMSDGVVWRQKVLGRPFNATAIIITDVSNWLISSLYPAALKYQILGFCIAGDAISTYLKLSCKTFGPLMCWHVRLPRYTHTHTHACTSHHRAASSRRRQTAFIKRTSHIRVLYLSVGNDYGGNISPSKFIIKNHNNILQRAKEDERDPHRTIHELRSVAREPSDVTPSPVFALHAHTQRIERNAVKQQLAKISHHDQTVFVDSKTTTFVQTLTGLRALTRTRK